jgi:hypothetical protein
MPVAAGVYGMLDVQRRKLPIMEKACKHVTGRVIPCESGD